jgi:hypothetical protein
LQAQAAVAVAELGEQHGGGAVLLLSMGQTFAEETDLDRVLG